MLSLLVMLPELWVRRLHRITVASAPGYSADLTVVDLLVVLNHVFVDFSPLLVDALILLIQFVAILVSLVVQLVHCLFVVPVFIRLEITAPALIMLILTTLAVIKSMGCCLAALVVEAIYICDGVGCVFLHHVIRECLESSLLFAYFAIKWVDLAVHAIHSVVVDIAARVIVSVVKRTKLTNIH